MSDTLTDAEPPSLGRSASRGAVVTLAGQGVRIVVQLLGIVILARLLSPKDYGLIASVTAIIGVAETFRDFGLSSAAIQAKSITRAQKSNLFWINSSIGLGLALIVCACSPLIAGLYGQEALQSLTLLLSISFFFNGVSTQFRADLNRNLRFLQLSMVDIFAQILGLSVGITMALLGFGFWSLAGQQVSQDLFQLILVVILTKWFPGLPSRGAKMGGFLKFGVNLFGVQLLQYVSRNVASVVIGSRLGPVQLGLYNRAFQLMLLPLNQINAPSTRVALPVLSRLQDDAKRFGDFISFGQTVMLNLVTFILAFCGAQAYAIISISIGSQWLASVPIFQVLLIAAFFQTAGYVMYWIFLAKGLTKANLIYSVATRPLMIVVIIVGANWGVMGVAWAYALSITVVWPLGLLWISKVSDAPAMKLFLNGLRTIVIYGFATIVSYVSTMYLPQDALILRLFVGFVALVAALGLVALVWPKYRSDLKSMLDARRYFGKGKGGLKPAAAGTAGTATKPSTPHTPSDTTTDEDLT